MNWGAISWSNYQGCVRPVGIGRLAISDDLLQLELMSRTTELEAIATS